MRIFDVIVFNLTADFLALSMWDVRIDNIRLAGDHCRQNCISRLKFAKLSLGAIGC